MQSATPRRKVRVTLLSPVAIAVESLIGNLATTICAVYAILTYHGGNLTRRFWVSCFGIIIGLALSFPGWSPILFGESGACSADLSVDQIGPYLQDLVEKGEKPRPVHIFVEHGKSATCSYATKLHQAFQNAGWKPDDIKESDLNGAGVWMRGSEKDSVIFDLYERLSPNQSIRLYPDRSPKPKDDWYFFIKDNWPAWVNRANSPF